MKLLRDLWASLDSAGRIVFLLCVAGLLALAMWLGLDLSWVPRLLLKEG